MEQITLDALESALAPIEAIGKSEITFDVKGPNSSAPSTTVTLRMLLPEEEIIAQRYASEALAEIDEKKSHDALEYLERFKIGVLSYTLVVVGPLDLHGVDYIETGEILENGTKIKEPKHLAMRKLLFRWTQDIRTRMFNKYHELLLKVELEAEKAIEFEPVDLATEIERVEKRLEDLKKAQEEKGGGTSVIRDQLKEIAELDKSDTKDRRAAVDAMSAKRAGIPTPQPDEDVPLPENIEASPALGPQRTNLTESKPAVFHEAATPPPERPVEQPETQTQPEQPVKDEKPPAPVWENDSFIDPGDTDGMMAAVHAENQKLLAARRGQLPPEPSAMNAMRAQQAAKGEPVMRPGVRPPHADARAIAEDLESEETRILNASRKAMTESTGKLGEAEVYRQPAEVLDRLEPDQASQQGVALNRAATPQSANPRFKPVNRKP